MNTKDYDRVVEVKKYVKKSWPTNCLDFALRGYVSYERG